MSVQVYGLEDYLLWGIKKIQTEWSEEVRKNNPDGYWLRPQLLDPTGAGKFHRFFGTWLQEILNTGKVIHIDTVLNVYVVEVEERKL